MYYYIIYKITNIVNNKIYIGSHKTKNINDGYMGSGKYLIASQKKYGLSNFKKEVFFVFNNPEEMYAKEAELVNEEFLITENTYNLKVGGYGGWDFVNSNNLAPPDACFKGGKAIAKLGGGFLGKKHSVSTREKMKIDRAGRAPTFKGKAHTEETKEKIRQANRINSLGNKNASKKIELIDKHGNIFSSVKECADFYKVSTTAIYKRKHRGLL